LKDERNGVFDLIDEAYEKTVEQKASVCAVCTFGRFFHTLYQVWLHPCAVRGVTVLVAEQDTVSEG
jgi:hypothetical protein